VTNNKGVFCVEPKAVVEAFVRAHNAHDLDAMMELLTDDGTMVDVASPIKLESKADVRRLYESIFAAIDITFEITAMIAEGDTVFVGLRTTGIGIGEFQGRDVTGARCDVAEGMLIETQDGRIHHTVVYSDTATLTRQLGYATAASTGA
jgi:steroid delta-isomerase-like uncharacterized protein